MGKIAVANTNYCGAFPTGSLSVNGKIFSTENPPISYTISGTIATILDGSLSVIGTADLTGNLVPVETHPAEPEIEYCGGKPKAKLIWSSGEGITTNPPISYTLVSGSGGIQVDWGGGDIDILTGTSWTISDVSVGGWFEFSRYRAHWAGCVFVSQIYALATDGGVVTGVGGASSSTGYPAYPPIDWNAVPVSALHDKNPATSWTNISESEGRCGMTSTLWGRRNGVTTRFRDTCAEATYYFEVRQRYTVTSNTGQTSTRAVANPPNVSLIPSGYNLTVTDSTGTIADYSYEAEPTNFEVTCYDYDIKESASYACQGECPAGTEFQCICPETNTLSCYGFDPDNPDIFKVLFSTVITG